MARLSREALLGASDLVEREVELPTIGGSVKVRSLPATYSNRATSEAIKLVQGPKGEQTSTIDQDKLELLQLLHGLADPKLGSIEDARAFATNCGPAFKEVIRVIDEISGVDKAAIEDANARFPAGRGSQNGEVVDADPPAGGSGSDLPVRAS